jgi:hypothetical protein
MEQESTEIKNIIVYKAAVSPQKLKSLCDQAYKDFDTPLKRINSVINKLRTYKRSLKDLEVTREEWCDIEDNKTYKNISRRLKNKAIKQLDDKTSSKKYKKNIY